MSVEVDDLFRGGDAPPPPDPTPRLKRLARIAGLGHTVGLLGGAVALALALSRGEEPPPPSLVTAWLIAVVVYLLVVPSVVVTLYTWHRATEELDRVRAGGLPRAYGRGILELKRGLRGWLVVAVVMMLVQLVFLLPLLGGSPEP